MNREKEDNQAKEKSYRCCPAGIPMTVVCRGECITKLYFGWKNDERDVGETAGCRTVLEAERQLEEYFRGQRRQFELPVRMEGTDFQKKVWNALGTIPYGETRSYSEIAEQIGQPKAVRAVGMANHRNPLVILVPCHRVIGKDGSMTGYAGGIGRKEMLLKLERQYKGKDNAKA